MAFGVTTNKAHLDTCDPTQVTEQEIDWVLFKQDAYLPEFAGRYFLGQPSSEQSSFPKLYLWAHGEGSKTKTKFSSLRGQNEPVKELYIVPIQKANPDRQQAQGAEGEKCGWQDAFAICEYISKCIEIGEVLIPEDKIYIFLEVLKGTTISPQYWSSWCSTVYDYVFLSRLAPAGRVLHAKNPFLPCICCQFEKTVEPGLNKYLPDTEVSVCLHEAGLYNRWGGQTLCHGFWAIVTEINEYQQNPKPNLDWSMFDVYQSTPSGPIPYRQPQGSSFQPVPVLLWRYRDWDNKLTLDAVYESSNQDHNMILMKMLRVRDWSLQPQDHLPNEFGIDTAGDVSSIIGDLATKEITVNELPYAGSRGYSPINELRGRISFAIRYYSTRQNASTKNPKDISEDEARLISHSGASVISIWQSVVKDPSTCGCGNPFYHVPPTLMEIGRGIRDAKDAFTYAAKIGQPPYTPVFFAVDAWVKKAGGRYYPARDINGDLVEVEIPRTDQIVTYFSDINRGYEEYLRQNKRSIPYYIGVYASSNVLDACYINGLATYFWQAWPYTWGDGSFPNLNVWSHNNVWQVFLWNSGVEPWIPNAEIVTIANQIKGVDVNVAWGDTGGWKIF